ncbi:hypothetical protein JCM8208_002752 [Rhodotorula glutinis]
MALHLPAHSLQDAPPSPITGVHLNADGSAFATSTTEGWVVYRTQPLEVLTRRDLPDASLRIVLPLSRSNLLFLVGGPPSPLYPPNKVILWDARAQAPVAELEFREDVRGLRARRDRLVVVLRRRVVLFVLGEGDAGIWREGAYETCDNPRGLAALATAPRSTLLAFPGRQPGQVQLVRLPPLSPPGGPPPLPPPPSHDPTAAPHPATSVLLAHESPLAALATSEDGRVLATGSSRGTLVRIWDAAPSRVRGGGTAGGGGGAGGTLARELRRGTDSAEIFDVALSREGDRCAVASDKGTVHVWDLRQGAGAGAGAGTGAGEGGSASERERAARNGEGSGASTPRSHQLSLLKPYLPKYFSSEWSHAQFRLPPPPGATTTSRLPFSLSNPGPYPNTPFSGAAAAEGEGGGMGRGKGAASVEDDVCVCAWIEVDALEEEAVPGPAAAASAAAQVVPPHPRPRAQGRASSAAQQQHARPAGAASSTSAAPPPRRKETQLVALTRSGGWYRLAFDPLPAPTSSSTSTHPSSTSSSSSTKAKPASRPSSGTSTPRAERDPGVKGLARDSTGGGCRLVEYRRFGGVEGW